MVFIMRLFNFIIHKTNVFFMGKFIDCIDYYLVEAPVTEKLHPFFQITIILSLLPIIIMILIIIIIGTFLYYVEKIITKLIYRNTINVFRCKIPGSSKTIKKTEDIFFKNLKKDFGYKFNYYTMCNGNNNKNKTNLIYFLKKSDISWFILKYPEYIIK